MFFNMFYGFLFTFLLLLLLLQSTLMQGEWYVMEILLFKSSMFDFKMYFYMDWMSNLFLMIVSLISAWTFFFSKFYMEMDKKKSMFILLTFMFVISMFLMVTGMNMWMLLLGWDGLGLVSYFLVIYYQMDSSYYSGMFTVLINRLGDIGMILSIYFMMNCYSLDIIIYNIQDSYMNMFMLLMIMGCFTKSAQFPFSSWLPLAMAAPTPISALVHSSTLVTAGVYMVIRFNLMMKSNGEFCSHIYLISLFTMFMAGVISVVEVDMKKIIAYSTLSQLGLMMMVSLLGNELMAFYHLLTHALFKALLFLCSGILIHEFNSVQDVRKYGLTYKTNYLIMGVMTVCSYSLMGFPFLSGFYSKDLILEYVYTCNMNFIVLIMVAGSTMLTSVYSLRLLHLVGVKGKNLSVYISQYNWEGMNWSLVYCFFLVLSLGSMMGWLLVGKLDILYLTFGMKLLNTYLVFFGFLFFLMIKSMIVYKGVDYLLSMLYLTKFQGFISNLLLQKFVIYTNLSDIVLEDLILFKNESLLSMSYKILLLSKFMLFYVFLLLLVLLLYVLVCFYSL